MKYINLIEISLINNKIRMQVVRAQSLSVRSLVEGMKSKRNNTNLLKLCKDMHIHTYIHVL